MEVMKAVSFMYVRPPGYNPESAKAAEIEDAKKKLDQAEGAVPASSSSMPEKELDTTQSVSDKKSRPKDVFGRSLPTEQEFEVLKNAPRLDTGAPARPKPFGVEVRNVRCLRCGNYGHQSGDRECPMKDVIMPNEESRLKRDDPLTAIKAQTDSSEPLKWELKQKPGMSPPRGGYNPDDPNQQIVAEDIFDEYGGFLGDVDIPALLTNFSVSKSKKHSRSKSRRKQSDPAAHAECGRHHSSYHLSAESAEPEKRNRTVGSKRKKKYCSESSYSDDEVVVGKEKAKQKSNHRHKKKHLPESCSDSEVEADTRHLKREHIKKKREELEIALSSFSRDKEYKLNKRHSRRSREKQHYSDSSSSESEWHSMRWQDKQPHSDSSSSQSKGRSRRSREKRHHYEADSPESDRPSRKSKEKRSYTHLGRRETDRHSRRSREKRHYSDPSSSDYSDSDRRNSHRRRQRK